MSPKNQQIDGNNTHPHFFFTIIVIRTLPQLSPRWLLLFGVFILFWRLNYAPLWNPDEGRYASAALEMTHPFDGSAPDWVVPHLNTIPRLNKPPLVYWLGAASFNIFGVSTAAARLAPALAAVGVLFLLFVLGKKMFGERAGIAGSLVWATAGFPVGMARTFNTDMLLTSAIALAFGGIWLAVESTGIRQKWGASLLAGVGLGLALLAKGPVGLALPLLICFVYLCVARRWGSVPWAGVATALVMALSLAIPWFLAVEKREPGFLHRFIIEENFGRFSGKEDYHDPTPIYYYLPVVILGLLPWTAFILPTCVRGVLKDDDDSRRARLFLWLWGGLLVAFFSISKTKLISYVLPAFPAFCLLIGEALGGTHDKRSDWPPLVRWIVLSVALLLNTILVIAAGKYLLDDRTLPRAEAIPYLVAAVAILVCGSIALVICWLARDRWRLMLSQTITAIVLFVCLLQLAGRIALFEDASSIFISLKPHLQPSDRLVEYRTFQPSAIFYLKRDIPIYEFVNNSGLDEEHPNFKRLYRDEKEFQEIWEWPERTFVLIRRKHGSEINIPANWSTVAINNDYELLSNRPAPDGFSFDYVAPGKRIR
jgi:4-amino-4-deoxy-L-arabinose transferase-like glycosyltransferase